MSEEPRSASTSTLAPLDVARLFAESLPQVYAFAYRMLGDHDRALDAAQESFARAFERASSFRGESAPLTWILSIARNQCLTHLRDARRRSFADFEALIESAAETASPTHSEAERRVYVAEVKEGCLVGLLQCLPVAGRTVFVLHLLCDLPIAEVATVMGRSPNAVRILLSRARASMREFLCDNCRLAGGLACSCENMIEFSLRAGLIERYRPAMSVPQVRDEVRVFSDEVDLYRSLPDATERIADAIASGRFALFGGSETKPRLVHPTSLNRGRSGGACLRGSERRP